MNGDLRMPAAVVAHDAGAANLIVAWLDGMDLEHLHVFMEGPARLVWESQKRLPLLPLSCLSEVLGGCCELLSGTGWGNIEFEARVMAAAHRVRNIAVLDHWVNYGARFVREGRRLLPDEIWVADDLAAAIAGNEFPGVPVVQRPNRYLELRVDEIHRLASVHAVGEFVRVLYLLEPLRPSVNRTSDLDEISVLLNFLANLDNLGIGSPIEVVLRPHPSEPEGKYDRIRSGESRVRIRIDRTASLAAQMAWADIVVGCHTYALAIALAAGKRTICSLPSGAEPCAVPLPGIEQPREVLGDSRKRGVSE